MDKRQDVGDVDCSDSPTASSCKGCVCDTDGQHLEQSSLGDADVARPMKMTPALADTLERVEVVWRTGVDINPSTPPPTPPSTLPRNKRAVDMQVRMCEHSQRRILETSEEK